MSGSSAFKYYNVTSALPHYLWKGFYTDSGSRHLQSFMVITSPLKIWENNYEDSGSNNDILMFFG